MNRTIQTLSMLAVAAVLIFSSCSSSNIALAVNDLKITKIDVVNNTSNTSLPPVTYDITVTWNTADILANETAAAAFNGLEVYIQSGSEEAVVTVLSADAKTYKFTGLTPGESTDLRVKAVYPDDTYPDASFTDYTGSISFRGGPWYDGDTTKMPAHDGGFGVGSFNNLDSMPSSYSDASNVYYFNTYNTDYQFKAAGDVVWLTVDVTEKTEANDILTQRNNVEWLNANFQLLDVSTGLANNNDIANVDAWVYDIYGHQLLSLTGSETTGIMSDFSTLLASVDSGYYADKTGYYFIKAQCKSMPTSYSDSNKDDKYGLWGFANNGTKH